MNITAIETIYLDRGSRSTPVQFSGCGSEFTRIRD